MNFVAFSEYMNFNNYYIWRQIFTYCIYFQKLKVDLAVLLVYKTWSKMNAKVRSWHSNSNVFIFPLYPSQAGAPQSSGIQCRAKLISKHKCQDDWMKLVTTGSSQIGIHYICVRILYEVASEIWLKKDKRCNQINSNTSV